MSIKIIPPKLARKDLLALYDITHPTLRTWLRRAGLAEFNGRRRFFAHEVVLIFQALGRPRLARTAAQRLKDVYARFKGLLADEIRFRDKYQQELPTQRQDCLPKSAEELDAPPVYQLNHRSHEDPLHIHDALARLTATAIYLIGQKARKKMAHQVSDLSTKAVTRRKQLRKGFRRRLLIA